MVVCLTVGAAVITVSTIINDFRYPLSVATRSSPASVSLQATCSFCAGQMIGRAAILAQHEFQPASVIISATNGF
jgi:hypothetical protein